MLGIVCGLAAMPFEARAQTGSSNISTLEGLVSELAELRQQIATERREWREDKPHLEREIGLLQKEKEQLERELSGYRQEQSDIAEERAGLISRRERLKATKGKVADLVARAEANLRTMYPKIPNPLLGELESVFEALPETDEAAEKRSVTRRLQKVLAIYNGIQKRQHEIGIARSLVELEGQQREMDVLYLGFTQAFAVSANGTIGAAGELDSDEWVWKRRDGLAPKIRKAVAIFRNEEPACLVSLPLEIKGGE